MRAVRCGAHMIERRLQSLIYSHLIVCLYYGDSVGSLKLAITYLAQHITTAAWTVYRCHYAIDGIGVQKDTFELHGP